MRQETFMRWLESDMDYQPKSYRKAITILSCALFFLCAVAFTQSRINPRTGLHSGNKGYAGRPMTKREYKKKRPKKQPFTAHKFSPAHFRRK